MNALNKKITRNRELELVSQTAAAMLKAALLTADDLWGVDKKQTDMFVNAYAEIINGYGEDGGIDAIDRELAERGIEVDLKGL